MKKLFRAAEQNDTALVKTLLDAQTDSKKRLALANAALASAAWFGATETAALLLDEGANVNRRDGHGDTALIYAAQQGKRDTAKLLVERGAKLEIKARSGRNALLTACVFGHPEVVRYLLAKGADVHVCNESSPYSEDGEVALLWAIRGIRPDVRNKIVAMLLEHGARVNASVGTTPLLRALERGDRELVEMLLTHGADVHAKDSHGNDALTLAARHPDPAVLRLIQSALDPDT